MLFDEVPVFGVQEGLGRLTLTAYVQDLDADGRPVMRQVVVAHLRGQAGAFRALRRALDGLDQLAAGPPGATQTRN